MSSIQILLSDGYRVYRIEDHRDLDNNIRMYKVYWIKIERQRRGYGHMFSFKNEERATDLIRYGYWKVIYKYWLKYYENFYRNRIND